MYPLLILYVYAFMNKTCEQNIYAMLFLIVYDSVTCKDWYMPEKTAVGV